ncbi:hypothetical protein [Achromobacter marplatensis]|uniref:hypothetical protein n=1 Tax=Achromobacter marplatensis TaxID=470868 RepID=UPI0039F66EF1
MGVPLAILLAITWIAYMVRDRGQMPGRVHALLFAPTLLALMIYPVSDSIERGKYDTFSAAHPPIGETHVNLSGNDLWLDTKPYASTASGAGPNMPLAASKPERFAAFIRYPSPKTEASGSETSPAFPYSGARLNDKVQQYTYRLASGDAGASLPLKRLAYPDLKPLFAALGKNEAAMLRYFYYHYPDHVEVAPALQRLAGMTEQRLDDKTQKGLVLFKTQNYAPHGIARLEINGQTLDIGEQALTPVVPLPASCHDYPYPAGGAFADLSQPLTLRWQTLDAPQVWHTATLQVPAFRQPESMDGESTLMRVQLYFLPDGSVEGERFVEVRKSRDQLAIRATGLPTRAAAYAGCGGAFSAFNPQTVKLLAD